MPLLFLQIRVLFASALGGEEFQDTSNFNKSALVWVHIPETLLLNSVLSPPRQ